MEQASYKKPFELEHELVYNFNRESPFDTKGYKNWTWPYWFKVTLGDLVLGTKGTEFQYPDYSFRPDFLLSTAGMIMDGQKTCHGFGDDSLTVRLDYTPISRDEVRISLRREDENYHGLWEKGRNGVKFWNFDSEAVPDVILLRKKVAFEFLKFINDLYHDLERYEEREKLEGILQHPDNDLFKRPEIVKMFSERNISLYPRVAPEERAYNPLVDGVVQKLRVGDIDDLKPDQREVLNVILENLRKINNLRSREEALEKILAGEIKVEYS